MIEEISKWVPPAVLVVALFGVIAVLFRVLKIIVSIKHGEIMTNFDKLNGQLGHLTASLDKIKDDFRDATLKMQYQLSQMVTRDEHNKDMVDINTRMKTLERILRMENQ